MLSQFSCPKNPDVETFIRTKAIDFEKRDASRTYLILDDDTVEVLAYFSLTFKEIEMSKGAVSKTVARKMDGFTKEPEKIRAFLIGQLGRNFAATNRIDAGLILQEAYGVIDDARKLIGGRTVILECQNSNSLVSLYEKNGFKRINMEPNHNGDITMYLVFE